MISEYNGKSKGVVRKREEYLEVGGQKCVAGVATPTSVCCQRPFLFRTLNGFDASSERIDRAADMCRGLTRFAIEQAVSRNLPR